MNTAMWMRASVAMVGAAAAAISVGCTQQAQAVPAVVNDKVYSVTPATLMVKAGIVSGEATDLKVTESVEEGTGRVTAPARLSGKLTLKNVSSDQTVRLLSGKIVYIDTQGKAIELGDDRTQPTVKVASPYDNAERLDPGQETTQDMDVDFPVAALKAKKLKEIRLDLEYIPSPFKAESLRFAVSIGG